MNHKSPLLGVDGSAWLKVLRGIARATDERTVVTGNLPSSAVGHSAPVMDFECARAVQTALILANLNSLPLDWAARLSVGGVNLSFFILKQLPVMPPEAYLERVHARLPTYVELVVPRVLELSYTAHDLEGFARNLGYEGPPFPWNNDRRHRLRCDLDAIYAHMYALARDDLKWIIDAAPPSSSFPTLKESELRTFGEYRTRRLVLDTYDRLSRNKLPRTADYSQHNPSAPASHSSSYKAPA